MFSARSPCWRREETSPDTWRAMIFKDEYYMLAYQQPSCNTLFITMHPYTYHHSHATTTWSDFRLQSTQLVKVNSEWKSTWSIHGRGLSYTTCRHQRQLLSLVLYHQILQALQVTVMENTFLLVNDQSDATTLVPAIIVVSIHMNTFSIYNLNLLPFMLSIWIGSRVV